MLDIPKKHEFLVAFDSDGCVFDTMELKHKECFIPQIINHYGLQAVSKYAREAAEFVNLYSKSRGINRYPALIEALEWLQKRPEVQARGVKIEIPPALRDWIKNETKLGNPALEAKVKETNDPELTKALAKFVSSKSRCYDKCNQNVFKAKIPEGSCDPPTPSDAATVTCIQKAETKTTQLIDKVCFTAPATPPACYDGSALRPNSGAGWTSLAEGLIDGQIPTIACGSASSAFLD